MVGRPLTMLTWETIKVAAYLDGYLYIITRDDDEPHVWGVEITDPGGGVVHEVCLTPEEAKQFCENTAREVPAVQAEE
jgi:hypothetical protein